MDYYKHFERKDVDGVGGYYDDEGTKIETSELMDTPHMIWEHDGFMMVEIEEAKPKIQASVDCRNCHECLKGKTEHGPPITATRMILCPTCGNKRCPRASDHNNVCTRSNDTGQEGSIY